MDGSLPETQRDEFLLAYQPNKGNKNLIPVLIPRALEPALRFALGVQSILQCAERQQISVCKHTKIQNACVWHSINNCCENHDDQQWNTNEGTKFAQGNTIQL